MKCLPLLLLACAWAALPAQITDPPPDELLDAAHCLATASQDWLGLAKDNPAQLEMGYVSDNKSYPGQDLLNVVDYTTRTHSAGMVFNFLTKGKDPHRILRLQFRTRFRQTDDGTQQLELVDPPLGGIWTQDQVLSAIRQIGFHTYTVPISDVFNRPRGVQCESSSAVE